MHVTVVIVGFRNADDVARCVEAVNAQTHPSFDIAICENGGNAASDALRVALGEVAFTLLEAPDNPGYAGGINRCLAATPGSDAWWILNPDTIPNPDALERMVERLQRGDADAVGSTLIDEGGAVQSVGGRFHLALARSEAIGDPASAHRMNFVSGASMLISRRWLEGTGPLREEYFLYCEEVEWCLRAQGRGLRIALAPDACVIHHQGSTTGSAGSIGSRQRLPIVLDERNKLNTVRDIAPWLLVMAIPASFLLALLRYGRHGAWRQLGYALSGWFAGVRNERGKPRWLNAPGGSR